MCALVRVCVFVVSWLLFRGGFVRVWTYDRCVSSFVYCRVSGIVFFLDVTIKGFATVQSLHVAFFPKKQSFLIETSTLKQAPKLVGASCAVVRMVRDIRSLF